jgi:hypothetical protein
MGEFHIVRERIVKNDDDEGRRDVACEWVDARWHVIGHVLATLSFDLLTNIFHQPYHLTLKHQCHVSPHMAVLRAYTDVHPDPPIGLTIY